MRQDTIPFNVSNEPGLRWFIQNLLKFSGGLTISANDNIRFYFTVVGVENSAKKVKKIYEKNLLKAQFENFLGLACKKLSRSLNVKTKFCLFLKISLW